MYRLHLVVWAAILVWSASGTGLPGAQPETTTRLVDLQVLGPMDGPASSNLPVELPAGAAAVPAPGLRPYAFYPMAGNLGQDIDIANFVDQNPSIGVNAMLDYQCSDYTYDGHRGHDVGIFGFRQQELGVPIFAVLDGTVSAAHDGEFDMNTHPGPLPANFVELDHGGGHRTLYTHMKKGSVAVSVGQQVTAGTQIGLVGSSGSSTAPHLHFESRVNGVAYEPSAGNCATGASQWTRQPNPSHVPTTEDIAFSLSPFAGSANYPFDTAIRARGFSTGFAVTYWRIRFSHAPPNSSWRFEIRRPNGSIPNSSSGHFNNVFTIRSGAAILQAPVTFDVAGTWRVRWTVNDMVIADAPFTVVQSGTPLANRPPNPISAIFDPAAPRPGDVPFCRVQSALPVYQRDPDYDVMQYRYVWTIGDAVVRDVTTGAMADAIPRNFLTTNAQLKCSVTPMDGATSGAPAEISTIVGQELPTMTLDKTLLRFGAVTTGAAFSAKTSAQSVRLLQSGAGTVNWTAAPTVPWLAVSPSSGTGPATLNISAQFADALAAAQTGAVNLTFSGAASSTAPITVTLSVVNAQTATPPSGAFDTPINGSTGIAGSLAITGWAVDDVEVTGVRILRDPVAGEPAGQLVPIGHATLVEGARPDVAAAFPNAPRNTGAGWGYLMLTNFLPSLGNGTFKLTAIADDAEGRSTVLGTKTITCDNANAIAPFGAIDTPLQGGVASGVVTNFGWVLARNPRRADPPGGGTVRVVIDGAVISAVPSGWTTRSDLAAIFPASEYPGVNTALAVAAFDSTTLSNGVHTIAWSVIDNLGTAAGIGSRYFTVSNGSALRHAAPVSAFRLPSRGPDPITGRRGLDLDVPLLPLPRNTSGVLSLAAEELDRVELRVRATRGYLRSQVGDLALPIGSRFDPVQGIFTWLAGPGFLGVYDLVFETPRGNETVRVTLYPQGTFASPKVVIDTPAEGTEVSAPFVVAGWAVDPAARRDSGIPAIHVWAYPDDGGEPLFLGAATPAGERPDVAEIYGVQARLSGYGVSVSALPPGRYTLAVFGWSASRAEFLPAATRQVIVR